MTTVFAAGSMNIKQLDPAFMDRLAKIVSSNLNVVVGDANGADTSIQQALCKLNASSVVVYCSGDRPRNNVGDWPVHHVYPVAEEGTRAYFTAKDLEMADAADCGLMMWDAKSTGTLSNAIELVRRRKKCVVFVNKRKRFVTVSSVEDLYHLAELMSEAARANAESKIKLRSKIQSITSEQFSLTLEAAREKEIPGFSEEQSRAAPSREKPLNVDVNGDHLKRVWNQKNIPVVLRRGGKGQRLRIRIPLAPTNREWLRNGRKLYPTWVEKYKCWEIPKVWFNDFVSRALLKYKKLYIIQPYREQEKCAPACLNAVGHECQCSCMGANHGAGNDGSWFEVSETFACRWGDQHLACRLMNAK